MYRGHKIAIAIPCYNEEKLIQKTVLGIPKFVDLIIVIDDGSTDKTYQKAKAIQDKRVMVLQNKKNIGHGGSILRGFSYAIKNEFDIAMIVAGDAQCDPNYIDKLIDPVIDDECDYAKANRFFHKDALKQMPPFRRVGNMLLSILTKFSTGYYSISDSQNSYSAIKTKTLERMNFDEISPRYEFENSYLIHLALIHARIKDVPVPAIYGEETSTIKFFQFVRRTCRVLFTGFFKRLYYNYLFFDFHPVGLFFIAGSSLIFLGLGLGVWVALNAIGPTTPSTGTVMLFTLPFLTGFQLALFAVLFDILNEPK